MSSSSRFSRLPTTPSSSSLSLSSHTSSCSEACSASSPLSTKDLLLHRASSSWKSSRDLGEPRRRSSAMVVSPLAAFTYGSAPPALTSKRATSPWPARQARSSAVRLLQEEGMLVLAPAESSCRQMDTWPRAAAACSGVQPEMEPRAEGRAPASSSDATSASHPACAAQCSSVSPAGGADSSIEDSRHNQWAATATSCGFIDFRSRSISSAGAGSSNARHSSYAVVEAPPRMARTRARIALACLNGSNACSALRVNMR
mmetsp:Transcript_85199/g.170215  ORF Transcript_85199/g.170215 Transcript_85199/m.170215 type:complete len:258 (+) Transcript_85199:516-1289(+)